MNGEIHIEGKGVPPTVKVPVNEETSLTMAIQFWMQPLTIWIRRPMSRQSTPVRLQLATVTDEIAAKSRVHYTIEVKEGDVINLHLGDEAGELDTILSILDTAGNSLLANDDAEDGDTVNSAITDLEIPVDLTLIIEVATANDAGAGTYTLRGTGRNGVMVERRQQVSKKAGSGGAHRPPLHRASPHGDHQIIRKFSQVNQLTGPVKATVSSMRTPNPRSIIEARFHADNMARL
ncbi:MAG: hypothetical protein R2932_00680 [Caldilineaceae bacterium]